MQTEQNAPFLQLSPPPPQTPAKNMPKLAINEIVCYRKVWNIATQQYDYNANLILNHV